jgi:integrase
LLLLLLALPSQIHHKEAWQMASIRQHLNGRWQAQVRRRGILPVTRTFHAKQDAERWARHTESEIDRGAFLDRSEAERTTFGELIGRYLAEVTPQKKSARSERQRLCFLARHFGRFAVAAIRNRDIAAYRDKRLQAGLAPATVLKELNSLSSVFDTAIQDWGLPLSSNPVKLVRRPSAGKGRERRLSESEEGHLIAACRESRAQMLAPAVQFALETGMRLGEILGLQWTNVDLRNRTALLPDTKNGESRRVPLSSRATAILAALPRHISENRAFWLWRRPDSFEHSWRRAATKAGLSDLRFHDLRHEATSRFFERGLTLPEVAAITGHKTWQMLRRYTHLDATHLARRLG